jgi:lipoate-protein ligase A
MSNQILTRDSQLTIPDPQLTTHDHFKELWQYLQPLCESAEATMQRDRVLFKKIKNQFQKPILRFYYWQKQTLSYGRTQGLRDSVRRTYESQGWDIVQRPTGGGIVLHGTDLCFSILWRKENEALPWKIQGSYQLIHEWIQWSLGALGIRSRLKHPAYAGLRSPNPHPGSPLRDSLHPFPSRLNGRERESSKEEAGLPTQEGGWCFESPICYDLVHEGRKVVGGAQWRDGNTALHQGSIQLALPERSIFIFKRYFEKFFNVQLI